MALVLNEEQSMLRDSARGLISDKAPVSHLRQLRDNKDATGFSRELWKAFAEMGFTGLLVPEDFGGSGVGCCLHPPVVPARQPVSSSIPARSAGVSDGHGRENEEAIASQERVRLKKA